VTGGLHILAISPGEGFQAERWARVAGSGVDAFMVREPALEARERLRIARWLREGWPGLEVWVNGRLDVALRAGCGLHAPEAHPEVDPALLPLSRPVHDPAQIPARAGARQLILSPIHPVPAKNPPWGPERLARVLDGVAPGPRVLALGGVGPGNVAALRHPRLDGVALLRSLWTGPDPARTIAGLRDAWG